MLTIYTFRDLRLWIFCGDTNSGAHATYWVTTEGDFASLYVSHAYSTNGSSARVQSCVCCCVRADRVGACERSAQTSERDVFEDISRGESIAIRFIIYFELFLFMCYMLHRWCYNYRNNATCG